MSSKSRKLQLYQRHPVVSTLLWIFGTDFYSHADSSIDSTKSNSDSNLCDIKSNTGTLTWKDDHGGHIAEYIQVIQVKQEDNEEKGIVNSLNDAHSQLGDIKSNRHDSNDNSEIVNQSPQWGFYVSITPPQDTFPRSNQCSPPLK